jgi:flagellin
MVINTNIAAENSARLLASSSQMLQKSLARLSSGSRIVDASDDAAGTAVALRLNAQVNRVAAASNNIGSAISFNQTQDGFLGKVANALDRMSELAISAQDVTKSNTDRSLYNREFAQLADYINNVATKDFNGVSLFGGATLKVTVDSDGNTFDMAGVNLGAGTAYAAATAGNVSTTAAAATALANVKLAIAKLAEDRAQVGANSTRLNYTSDQLAVLKQNLVAATSRITDVDIAEESTQYAKYNILVQAGTAMLAQANVVPQSTLKLLS